jgi:flagellar basal body-associated protein FliL
MNKKIIIIAVAALVLAGGAYKTVLAKPKEKAPEPKVHGTVYVLPKEFLVNLADGRYAKLQVALVVEAATARPRPRRATGPSRRRRSSAT